MNMTAPKGITCTMRPSESLLRTLGQLGRVDPREAIYVNDALNQVGAVDALAKLLDEAMSACTNKSGHLDLREMAAYMHRVMRENPK